MMKGLKMEAYVPPNLTTVKTSNFKYEYIAEYFNTTHVPGKYSSLYGREEVKWASKRGSERGSK
jgi:hypothetical protein